MRHTVLDGAFHYSHTESMSLQPGGTRPDGRRWGHGGVFATVRRPPTRGSYLYWLPGPHAVLEVDDDHTGSFHLMLGYGEDAEFNSLLAELGPIAGIGSPPFLIPEGMCWIDHGYALHRVLRERLETEGYDGYWCGGEVVLWDYERLAGAELVARRELAPDHLPEPSGEIDYGEQLALFGDARA
jgi:hypothetical protein